MRYDTENEIKKLIKAGFDLKLISFELDIPEKELKHIQDEIEIEKRAFETNTTKRYSATEILEKEHQEIHLKMKNLREKYNKLYKSNNKEENEEKVIKEMPEEELKLIDSIIKDIESSIEKMKEQDKKEKRKTASSVLQQLKKIEQYELAVEQAEKMNYLMNLEQLEKLRLNQLDHIEQCMKKYKRIILKKLTEAVDIAQSQTQDIEKLKQLKRKLTNKMFQNNQIVVGTVRDKIDRKIAKLNYINVSKREKDNISANIEDIVSELAQGTLDIQKAKQVIDEETIKRINNKPKTIFVWTEEQEKKQIFMKIESCLKEKIWEYHIENPIITIEQMTKLGDGHREGAIRTVIESLIEAKDYERAKETCDQISSSDQKREFSVTIKVLRNKIKNAEIGDIVLKAIKTKSVEEERMYFRLIEKGLKTGNVKLTAIPLGKSEDGLRNIALADIWEYEKEAAR